MNEGKSVLFFMSYAKKIGGTIPPLQKMGVRAPPHISAVKLRLCFWHFGGGPSPLCWPTNPPVVVIDHLIQTFSDSTLQWVKFRCFPRMAWVCSIWAYCTIPMTACTRLQATRQPHRPQPHRPQPCTDRPSCLLYRACLQKAGPFIGQGQLHAQCT